MSSATWQEDLVAQLLIIDDHDSMREGLELLLRRRGHRTVSAESGQRGLELLAEIGADLVITDLKMAQVDGIEVLRRIKADKRLSDVPVIMQTAAASPDQVREGLQAGAHYYLTKPFELEALQTIVRAALDDASQRRAAAQGADIQARVILLAESACFKIRTLEDAQHLAALLSNLFPEPQLGAMGLSELMINAIEHGNLEISFSEKSRLKEQDRWHEEVERRLGLPEYRDRNVTVTIERRAHEWEFVIEDQGHGFDWHEFLELDPERAFAPNGRGIALARQLAFASLSYEGSGNRVRAIANGEPA